MLNFNEVVREFSLKRVSEEELLQLRLGKSPFIIIKLENYLFVGKNPAKFSEIIRKCKHSHTNLCDRCRRFSALSRADGGCDKIRDTSIPFPYFNNLKSSEKDNKILYSKKDYLNKIRESFRIEKYSCVDFGIEVIKKGISRCIILKCNDFRADPPAKKSKPAYVYKTTGQLPTSSFEEEIHKKIIEKISSHQEQI